MAVQHPKGTMGRFLSLYWRLLAGIGAVERIVGILLIAGIVLIIFGHVISRYVFNNPVAWAEEVATVFFIWAVFIGASLGLKYKRHIVIEVFAGRVGLRMQSTLHILAFVAVAAVLLTLMIKVMPIIRVESKSHSISLPFPVPRQWFYSVPLLVGTTMMLFTCVYLILVQVWTVITNQPFDESHRDDDGSSPPVD